MSQRLTDTCPYNTRPSLALHVNRVYVQQHLCGQSLVLRACLFCKISSGIAFYVDLSLPLKWHYKSSCVDAVLTGEVVFVIANLKGYFTEK